ncbi:MAG: DUF934 domain-containing protein [Pseudomonadota bacterium]
MWQLDRNGALSPAPALDAIAILDPAVDHAAPDGDSAIVRFGGQADGRGFSVARRLRADDFNGTLFADGPLIPDQVRHAFQSGFDCILVDDARLSRHGAVAWKNALTNSVRDLYVAQPGSRGHEVSLWERRRASALASARSGAAEA